MHPSAHHEAYWGHSPCSPPPPHLVGPSGGRPAAGQSCGGLPRRSEGGWRGRDGDGDGWPKPSIPRTLCKIPFTKKLGGNLGNTMCHANLFNPVVAKLIGRVGERCGGGGVIPGAILCAGVQLVNIFLKGNDAQACRPHTYV